MTRDIEWSRNALDDLKSQLAYIAKDNPGAARRVGDRLRDAAEALAEIPTGRPGRISGTYEKSVTGLPYIVAYAITQRADMETIAILRVIHTARDWQKDRWPEPGPPAP